MRQSKTEITMNTTSNFHKPMPGDKAMYYCNHCKKSFSAKVPGDGIFSIVKKVINHGLVKCPYCKRPCNLDPRIQY